MKHLKRTWEDSAFKLWFRNLRMHIQTIKNHIQNEDLSSLQLLLKNPVKPRGWNVDYAPSIGTGTLTEAIIRDVLNLRYYDRSYPKITLRELSLLTDDEPDGGYCGKILK